MSSIKKYFKEEFQRKNLNLEHSRPADFYLSSWQASRSALPLLVFRILLFIMSLSITVASIISYILNGWCGYWWIYLTHWGLMAITFTTAFAVGVSARSHFYGGPISGENSLPWYIKVYWVLYNITVPLAFFITIFYWTVLFDADNEDELSHKTDIAVHGMNSVIMFLLLITSSQPSRLLHMYQLLVFGIVFFLFTLFYHLGGGINRDGEPFVYPVLNWSKAGETIGVGALTGLLLILMYVFVVGIARARDGISRKFIKSVTSEQLESIPLREQARLAV